MHVKKNKGTDFIFLGSKITVDGDCSREIKRCLPLGRKIVTNLDSILKSRDITLLTEVCIVKAMFFSNSHVWVWELDHVRRPSAKELMLSNCGPGEDSWESLGQQGHQTSQSNRKSTLNIQWKDWCWSWSSNPLATWRKEPTHWKRPWRWERLRAGGEVGSREWEG